VSNLLQLPLLSLPPSILRGSHLEPCWPRPSPSDLPWPRQRRRQAPPCQVAPTSPPQNAAPVVTSLRAGLPAEAQRRPITRDRVADVVRRGQHADNGHDLPAAPGSPVHRLVLDLVGVRLGPTGWRRGPPRVTPRARPSTVLA